MASIPMQPSAALIAQVNHLDPPPAFAIFTGDLINDDDPQSYRVLQQLTDQLRVPTYFALGNHDLRQPFRQVFLGEQQPGTHRRITTRSIERSTASSSWIRWSKAKSVGP